MSRKTSKLAQAISKNKDKDPSRGGATLELGGAMAPPNFFNSPLELVKKNYKLLKLHVNLFTDPPQILELTLSKFKISI